MSGPYLAVSQCYANVVIPFFSVNKLDETISWWTTAALQDSLRRITPHMGTNRSIAKMSNRPSGRAFDELRAISLEPGFSPYAEGSCMAKFGNTHVLCLSLIHI